MKIQRRHIGGFVFSVWALIAGGLLYFSNATKLISFDPQGHLGQKAASMDFDQQFLFWLNKQGLKTHSTVIHITEPDCPCFAISQPHRKSVAALATTYNFENQHIDWNEAMSDYVPASPAVVVISDNGRLAYFGPYSSGAFCTADNGLVEPFIKGKRQTLPGAVVITDAIGCYCNSISTKG
ncbi:MAG: DUF6436 domain-containing protein [Aestuariibacter sp.]